MGSQGGPGEQDSWLGWASKTILSEGISPARNHMMKTFHHNIGTPRRFLSENGLLYHHRTAEISDVGLFQEV
jgi:hypothetical protein